MSTMEAIRGATTESWTGLRLNSAVFYVDGDESDDEDIATARLECVKQMHKYIKAEVKELLKQAALYVFEGQLAKAARHARMIVSIGRSNEARDVGEWSNSVYSECILANHGLVNLAPNMPRRGGSSLPYPIIGLKTPYEPGDLPPR